MPVNTTCWAPSLEVEVRSKVDPTRECSKARSVVAVAPTVMEVEMPQSARQVKSMKHTMSLNMNPSKAGDRLLISSSDDYQYIHFIIISLKLPICVIN